MGDPDDPRVIKDTMRQHLDRLMRDEDIEHSTDRIRELKHSPKIRDDLERLVALRKQHARATPETFRRMALARCPFMHEHYSDILFKLIKEEADINLIFRFVDLLAAIEEGQLNQHEASFQVGTILKKIYIDSVLKRDELRKQEEEQRRRRKKGKKPVKKMGYARWAERNASE
jgi:hypothetical protein